jgi:glycerol dehydrogenase-like iron-containing ADH family enzyme
MTDVEFLKSARCAAYLGDEAGQLGATVKEQSKRRERFIAQRAEDEANQIARKIRRARTDVSRAVVAAEREQACAAVRAAEVSTQRRPKG